jgi:uncharacterized alpha-E superfamily protein
MAMLSRVAEHLYWMGRHLERAENTARLVNVNGSLVLDLPKHARPSWSSLIAITGSDELFQGHYPSAAEGYVVKFMLADDGNPGSILSSIRSARENARTVRDIIPREAWEQINEFYLTTRKHLAGGLSPKWRYAFLKEVILSVQQIAGILDGGMSHDAGFEFMCIGRNLERADMTTRIIDVRSANLVPQDTSELRPFDTVQWMSVLKSLTAYQMYRRSMQVRVSRAAVLRFLFQGDEFPRSVRHCVAAVEASVATLAHNEGPLRVLGRLKRAVMGTEVDHLSQSQLHTFIDDLQIGLGEVHDELSKPYFLPPVSAAPGG